MVRPERSADEARRCFTEPADESSARVSAGAPGSRLPPWVERPEGEAQRRKPSAARVVGREQERGPQHEVKPAASSDKQSESRARHVRAKATFAVPGSGIGAEGLGGVEGAARAEGSVRNRRDPSRPPESGQGHSYKPKAKARGVERESEGSVVPAMVAPQNAIGGKGPCFGDACAGGKSEGMTRAIASNHPGG